MDRKQAKAYARRMRLIASGVAPSERLRDQSDLRHAATLLRKMMVGVQWYNFRPYASRTYISKVANLPHLRDAPERERHALSRVRHGTHHKSRCEIEKS